MHDSNFEHAVVLLVSHSAEGALGVVISRESQSRMGDVLEEMDACSPGFANRRVLWGGPVEPGSGFVLWRGAGKEAWCFGEYSLSPSQERLADLMVSQADFWLCIGYAGWGPGQLDREVTEGSWIHIADGVAGVLEAQVADRYDEAIRLLGVNPDLIWMSPVDE
jgi:putative transcriptional regulator